MTLLSPLYSARSKWLASACAMLPVVFACSSALASTYFWNPQVRPPVSLAEAKAAAIKSLDKNVKIDALTRASLYGNAKGDASSGAWNLDFRDEKGESHHFYIDVDRQSHWDHWPNSFAGKELAAGLKSLEDIERAIKASHHLPTDAKIVRDEKSLTVVSHLRNYMLHDEVRPGEFTMEAKQALAPSAKGFRLHVEILKQGQHWSHAERYPAYWHTFRYVYPGFRDGEELVVDFEYGQNSHSTQFNRSETTGDSFELARIIGAQRWPETPSPAVDFDVAFAAANAWLGKEAPSFYCIEAHPNIAGSEVYWRFEFGATDGSQRILLVDKNSKAREAVRILPEFKPEKKIATIDDAERVLIAFFKSQDLKIETNSPVDGKLLVGTTGRKFIVHDKVEQGPSYATESREVTGPLSGGMRVSIRQDSRENFLKLAKQREFWGISHIVSEGPYFRTVTHGNQTANEDQVLVVEVQSGFELPDKIRQRLFSLFEEEVVYRRN